MELNPVKFGVSTFLTDESISPAVLGPALEERGLSALFLAEHTHIPVGSEVPYQDTSCHANTSARSTRSLP
jgi:hypothetical protein